MLFCQLEGRAQSAWEDALDLPSGILLEGGGRVVTGAASHDGIDAIQMTGPVFPFPLPTETLGLMYLRTNGLQRLSFWFKTASDGGTRSVIRILAGQLTSYEVRERYTGGFESHGVWHKVEVDVRGGVDNVITIAGIALGTNRNAWGVWIDEMTLTPRTGFTHEDVTNATGLTGFNLSDNPLDYEHWSINPNGRDSGDCISGWGYLRTSTIQGPATLSFYHKESPGETSSGPSIGNLDVRLDGVETELPSAADWSLNQITIPSGPHVLTFYGTVTPNNLNTSHYRFPEIFLDSFVFTPTPVPLQSGFSQFKTAWGRATAAASSDDDQDGVTLLQEYAFGGTPRTQDQGLLPTVSVVDGHLTLNCVRNPLASDIDFIPFGSTTMGNFSWLSSLVELTENQPTRFAARLKQPITQQPESFVRLRISLLNQ